MPFSGELFKTFCEEYPQMLFTEKHSVSMTDDLQYALELQRNRLKSKGLSLECTITPRGHFPNGDLSKEWSDEMFSNHMDIRSCNWARKIFSNGKEVFHDSQDQVLYSTATDLIYGAGNIDSENYTCPNCGNVTTIGELRNGCPYCGTFFELRDLYPRVSGFYYVKEIGGTEQEVKKDVFRFVIPLSVILGAVGFLGSLLNKVPSVLLWILQTLLITVFSAAGGAFSGYMIWGIMKLASVFYEAARVLPLLPGVLGSRKRYEEELKKSSPDFSFDYFANKAGTLARMLIFSDDPSSLPVCTGKNMFNPYTDVVDALFRGPVIVRSFSRKGDFCTVKADVQFDLLYRTKIGFINRRQFVSLYLSRDLSRPLNQHYSIRKVSCRNCGGSFDASRHDHCPYCGTEYDIRTEDWFVTGLS